MGGCAGGGPGRAGLWPSGCARSVRPARAARGTNFAGSALAARRADVRDVGRNGWIARHCVLGPRTHRTVDRFDPIRIIGRGVMGEVSLARCRKDGTYVALKAVSKGYVAKHNDERHLRNERDILAQLRHPFVVRLFGTFQDAQRIYFVLEYVAGGELFAKLQGHRCLGPNAATFYLAEILAALAHVHMAGYAYRDLKPENVLLDPEGHCRLVDFGFATAPPDGPDGLMRTNCGTPAYLSPEQLSRKKTGGYTRIVDWWAFGCVAYELMCGHTPFCKDHAADSHYAIYTRIVRGRISFPRHLAATPRGLVRELLRADSGKRLTDAASIQAADFFQHVDFVAVNQKRVVPPQKPLLLPIGDSSCFEEYRPRDRPEDTLDSSKCNFAGF
mmetsp:Transcript_9191/g.28646  ORF Transcript_9191/g.28646 Transcript_9191/m.28646 type:complete len:387 (-) Transcript_9191:8-1168(-)